MADYFFYTWCFFFRRLREKVKEKADSLERLRNELDAVEADIASTEVALNRNLQELELTQGAYDDRCEELASVERDLQDQVQIISFPNL